MARTLLLMIDGISADAFQAHADDLPTLHALAQRGLAVDRLASDVPATSLPGRTGIITGVSPAVHGIYGNTIHDGTRFRYATPDDVRIPTLPRRAHEAGLDVAVLGYGMVRRDDAPTFHHPWWVGEMIQRGRDSEPMPAEDGWLRTMTPRDDRAHLARHGRGVQLQDLPDPYAGDRTIYLMAGLEGDRRVMRHLSALATAENGPDLMLGEILIPDSIQHVAGQDHAFSIWSMAYADALLATLLRDLEAVGADKEVNLLILSDHGHGTVERAIYPGRVLPKHEVAPEGGTLFVVANNEAERREATLRLAEHGVMPLEPHPFPEDVAQRLMAFCAPAGCSFERPPDHAPADATSGTPVYASTHGLLPGTPSDDRFLMAIGPDVPARRFDAAKAADVEATLSTLAGLTVAGEGTSLV